MCWTSSTEGVLDLEEFWVGFTNGSHVIQPQLYAAYASNGADLGSALDTGLPQAVTIHSSHTTSVWSNTPGVSMDIVDGTDLEPNDHDDVSGSYKYFVVNDTSPQTWPNVAVPETFKDAGTLKQHFVDLPDSSPPNIQQYIHVNSLDMRGHANEDAAHIGPFLIDTVAPYWNLMPEVIPFRIDPTVPASDKTLVIGYPALIKWSSHDALSGVAEVRVVLEDLLTSTTYDIVSVPQETWNYSWFVQEVPATESARIVVTVTDLAGNDIVHEIPVKVVPHFKGGAASYPASDNGNCEDGRAIAADLHGDGFDDVVLVCRINGSGHLFVYGGAPNGLVLIQDFVWRAADDLVAADLDRDGDLDVATVSLAIQAGGNTWLDILHNDGTGTLFSPAISQPLFGLARKTVRVLTPYDRKKPFIFVFGVLGAANTPAINSYDVAAGYVLTATPGLDPVDGDWEGGDVDRDGYQDLVALGVDGSGTAALSIFSGSAGGWSRNDAETYVGATGPDVDLGDFDSDGTLDILVTFDDAGLTRVTKLLRVLPGASGGFVTLATFAEATDLAQQIAEGRGYITDHANDGQSEVVAMGLDAAGIVGGWYVRNDNIVGMLTDDAAPLITPLDVSDTAWGDFDNDGDLDLVQLGQDINGLFIANYENLLGTYIDQNDAPAPPANLSAVYTGTGYVFSWTPPAGFNDETPVAGLGYELRIGTTPNGSEILSWAHPAGASQQGSTLSRFVRLPQGNYYYDVRSVDSGWLRSQPAGVQVTP